MMQSFWRRRSLWHLSLILLVAGCSRPVDYNANQLAKSSSPYLREHADNPVHWQEWGDDVLAYANEKNKPIIVSIGYAACHWCHVMERESFMDTAIARIMNENFVCIKVDREERPDIDQVYIQAAELSSGNAGWPLNAFALPDGRPFYAATYFPRDQWEAILNQAQGAFKKDILSLARQASGIRNNIRYKDSLDFAVGSREPAFIKDFLNSVPALTANLDTSLGGLKGRAKFPMPSVGEFFLQYSHITNDKQTANWVKLTLDEIAYGGIYDQIGGGFSRYVIDSAWHVPHFEKMLYDNGQLVSLYAHAFEKFGDSLYLRIVDESLAFVASELTSQDGAFYSSINADSEGEEGKFYVWTEDEIKSALGERASDITTLFSLSNEGNWEKGKNILFIMREQRDEKTIRAIAPLKRALADVRSKRVRPSTDEKILASWNAMMLVGYVDAYRATGNQRYLEVAKRNGMFLNENMVSRNNEIYHAYLDGQTGAKGFLEDYAWTAKAFISLYQVTFDASWLNRAQQITDVALKKFGKQNSALYFFAPDDQRNPLSRKMEVYDNVIPSSNSVFAEVLYILGEYLQNDGYQKKAIDAVAQALKDDPAVGLYLSNWARLAQITQVQPFEVAVTGPDALMMASQIQRGYHPTALILGGNEEDLPLLENKVGEVTTIYVCRNRVCKQPTTDIKEALVQLTQY